MGRRRCLRPRTRTEKFVDGSKVMTGSGLRWHRIRPRTQARSAPNSGGCGMQPSGRKLVAC